MSYVNSVMTTDCPREDLKVLVISHEIAPLNRFPLVKKISTLGSSQIAKQFRKLYVESIVVFPV